MSASLGDAHQFPIYGSRFRVYFPILDADGDLVTGAAGLDSEVSQDAATFADCTNEATEIATSSGMYYLDLTATELDTKSSVVIVKTSTSGAKTTPIVLYPRRLPVLRTGTAQAGAAATITLDSGASTIDDFYNGCYVNITNDSPANARGQARRITDYVGSTRVATVESNWGTNPSSASTFEILLPGDVVQSQAFGGTEAQPATAGYQRVELNTGAVNATSMADNTITAAKIAANAIGSSEIADGAITAAKIATDAIDADALAADAVTEIQSGLATAAALDTVDNLLDTEIAAIITTLGTPAGASLAADIAAIEAQTDDIGAAGAGLSAVPWNAAWDAEVQSEVADALAAYDPPTNAEMEARTLAAASYATASALDAVDNFIDTEIGTIITHLTDIKGATFSGATDSLEAIRDRGDAAWVTATGFATAAALDAVDNFLDTEIAAIQTATDRITAARMAVLDDLDAMITAQVFTAPALANAPGGAGSGASVDDILDEPLSGHTTAGTVGAALNAVTAGSGSGARTVTFTVTASAVAVESAHVRMTLGGETYTATTGVDGTAVFNLDDGTYAYSVSKPGYNGASGTQVVNGVEAVAVAITAVAVALTSQPGQVIGYLDTYDGNHTLEGGVKIDFRIAATSGTAGQSHPRKPFSRYSDEDGRLETYLKPSTAYEARRDLGEWVAFTTPASGTTQLPAVLGRLEE